MSRSMSSQRWTGSTALVIASLFAISSVRATVVVNNLGETISGGASVFGTDPVLANATSFTTGPGSWQINAVTAKLEEALGTSSDGLVLRIMNDNGGNPGATVVGTFDMTTNNITALANYTYSPAAPIALAGNTTYWLAAFPTAADSEYYWQVTTSSVDNGVSGWSIGNLNRSSSDEGASWTPNGDEPALFSIDATSIIPEPCSLLLGVLALGQFGLARRRTT